MNHRLPALYRVRQFLGAIHAQRASAEELRQVQAILNPDQMALFQCLPGYDQRHSLEILAALRAAGHDEPAVLAAALLHDAAKTRLRLRHRALVTLVRDLAPGWAARLSQGDGTGWRAPFVIAAHHAAWGAEMAGRAGSDPLTVTLIRHHHQRSNGATEEDRLLAVFQAADDDS